MTATIVVMIIIGIIFIFSSYFITEKIVSTNQTVDKDLLAVKEDYEFSERELQIIKTKIEDVIARQAKDILYETNDSLASMANEKTIALGDYAVTVCDEIEKNHKEVMFLYSMLDDKQKELMETVKKIDALKLEVKDLILQYEALPDLSENLNKEKGEVQEEFPKNSALDQLSALKQSYEKNIQAVNKEKKEINEDEIKDVKNKEQKMDSIVDVKNIEDVQDIEDTEELDNIEAVEVEEEDIFSEIDEAEIDLEDVLEEEFEDKDNSNDIILEMYRNGNSILEIAKQLGLGVGEVRLVIDLYQGE